MNKIYFNSEDCYADRFIIPGMEPGPLSDACIENPPKSYPLEKGTIIECDGFRERFNIIINSVKEITSSYILYSGLKNKKGITKEIEIVELFVTPNDSRDDDGKTRLKTCISGLLEGGFYDLIENDSLNPAHQIIEYFCDEYGLDEHFIVANNTRYYVKMKKRECPDCARVYPSHYPHCPFCSDIASVKKNWLKRILKYFLQFFKINKR